MKFEKNSIIGIVLLGILLIGYFYFTRQGQIQLEAKQKHLQDSIAAIVPTIQDPKSGVKLIDSSPVKAIVPGTFQQDGASSESFLTLENDVVSIVFTNKGGQPKSVRLKQYASGDSGNVTLLSNDFNKLSYFFKTNFFYFFLLFFSKIHNLCCQ